MNEWKELKKDDYPPDIITGDYEWQWDNLPGDNPWTLCGWNVGIIFLNLWKGNITSKFRYRKPEPEKPLIVKFGGTLAAHWKDIDYLCIKTFPYDFGIDENQFLFQLNDRPGTWKPFSEIELTDEIALLRPRVILNNKLLQLVHVQDEGIYHGYSKSEDRYYTTGLHTRLATPHELQEAE